MASNLFFDGFDLISYDFTQPTDGNKVIEGIVNFAQRSQLAISDKDLEVMTIPMIVNDGITPEMMAAGLYNDPQLHWTIMYINDVCDLTSQWPINEQALRAFVTKKYGEGNEYNPHHYIKTPEGLVVDGPPSTFCQDVYGTQPQMVTNYDYENELNERKRFVRVINPQYINTFVQSFKSAQITAPDTFSGQ